MVKLTFMSKIPIAVYNGYEPWHTKTAWIRAIYDRAHKIFSNNSLFHKQVAYLKKVMSWNSYHRYIRHKIIKHVENRKNTKNTDTLEQENIDTVFCRIPYARVEGEKLIKNLVRKCKTHRWTIQVKKYLSLEKIKLLL